MFFPSFATPQVLIDGHLLLFLWLFNTNITVIPRGPNESLLCCKHSTNATVEMLSSLKSLQCKKDSVLIGHSEKLIDLSYYIGGT